MFVPVHPTELSLAEYRKGLNQLAGEFQDRMALATCEAERVAATRRYEYEAEVLNARVSRLERDASYASYQSTRQARMTPISEAQRAQQLATRLARNNKNATDRLRAVEQQRQAEERALLALGRQTQRLLDQNPAPAQDTTRAISVGGLTP